MIVFQLPINDPGTFEKKNKHTECLYTLTCAVNITITVLLVQRAADSDCGRYHGDILILAHRGKRAATF